MSQYQLAVAMLLAASVVCSLVTFYLTQPKEGKIKLSVEHDDGYERGTQPDPFDVTIPEDMIDGHALDEHGFWVKARLWKLTLSITLALALAVETVSLGFSASTADPSTISTYTLRMIFAIYNLTLSVRSVNRDDIELHSESLWHLSSLTFLGSFLLFATAILPTSNLPITEAFYQASATLKSLEWAVITLEFGSFVIVSTIPQGPPLHFDPGMIYSEKTIASTTNVSLDNVCGVTVASIWGSLLFSYTTKVVMLGYTSASLEIGDLPIVPANMRGTVNFQLMKAALRTPIALISIPFSSYRLFSFRKGSGWELLFKLVRLNKVVIAAEIALAAVAAVLFYTPSFFLKQLVEYLQDDPHREDRRWGWVFVAGLFGLNAFTYLITGQLWSLATTSVQVRLRIQLNSVLFAKTLVRKDVASSAAPKSDSDDAGTAKSTIAIPSQQPTVRVTTVPENGNTEEQPAKKADEDDGDFSSKAQIMTLMTTDVDRVSEFAWHMLALVDSPIEIVIGSIFLYKLLGVSCFFGLAVTCLFLPMNHFAGKVVVSAQDNLMKARDERVALMNEVLGGIRMLKFMAWERSFEARVLKIRTKELKYQKLNYTIETLWNAIWNGSPILVTLVSFWHFSVVRQQVLTPAIAFTSISVFSEMKFALNALPETLINMLQGLVSVRRIEKYLHSTEVASVPPLSDQTRTIALRSATVTWPQDRSLLGSRTPSAAPTPRHKFVLVDLSINFPVGKLSLICGKLGSGKTLLLLALLGEVDLLAGQVLCPRSPPDAIAGFAGVRVAKQDWIVEGICAYVPQAAWLRNASIKDNILFNLPFDEERYQKTLEVCALVSDLAILEDGDNSEIGERGVNLSGGQKARVSLARAVYSRASLLLLDDVLSAVDAHTAHHLYHECLTGDLMRGRSVILVSHHVQLCAPGASYIVALDNGRVQFQGDSDTFQTSGVMDGLVQSGRADDKDDKDETPAVVVENVIPDTLRPDSASNSDGGTPNSETSSTALTTVASENTLDPKKAPRKLVEEETRAVGRISREIWKTYILACGAHWYWNMFLVILILAAISPVAENWWLKYWSGSVQEGDDARSPGYYIGIYAAVTAVGLVITTLRWFVLYNGSIRASTVLYERLLETILFANIRFHDTVSRGRVLNRFGKDFEGIDSSLSDSLGRSFMYGLSAVTTLITVSAVGGLPFIIAAVLLGTLYYNAAKVYGQTSRDMRRLDSVTRSPLYSIYGETIAGVTILRAFGASSKFLRDMLRCVDTNANPYYWMWGVNRWLSVRFNLISSGVIGITGFVAVASPTISASLAGFALAFASTITNDLLFMVRRFVSLEQSMVAVERVKEYTDLQREPPEFIEPRPPASWPENGAIKCENLVIRYAPDLPDVLHSLNFDINPGEKVGILGRTGSGKSTLALSFFRFVEATEGRILVDGLDIAQMGLTDLRTKLTIIPQDPTILSGTLRSTLDVFDEYQDAEIYEALRRVHLIPSEDTPEEAVGTVNANVFRDLDSPVSEGGENFSTGEKQLLCMARAILKRSKVLVMDEATASVDYATDELISKTIRHEFAESTILTIAHRLRTVIDYDRVMLLDQGRIIEFDRPATLLSDSTSSFYALCKATGRNEFSMLKKMAGV